MAAPRIDCIAECPLPVRRARGTPAALPWALMGLLLCGLALVAGGCAGVPAAAEEAGPQAMPRDLSIGVTVFSEATDPARIERLERWRRPGRYIVEPDGVLRAARGAGVTRETFPPRIRRLDRAQMGVLWRLVEGAGLMEASHPDAIESEAGFEPSYQGTEALVTVIAGGEHRSVALALDRGTPEAAGVRRLIERLAELAWVRE